MRGLLAGRVSGRPLYPEAEMFKNLPYYLRVGNEADYFHLSSAARTRKGASGILDFRFLIADLDLPRGSFITLTIHPVREYKV